MENPKSLAFCSNSIAFSAISVVFSFISERLLSAYPKARIRSTMDSLPVCFPHSAIALQTGAAMENACSIKSSC